MAFLALATPACDRPPPAESLRWWTADDHHSADDDKLALGTQQRPGSAGEPSQLSAAKPGGNDVAELVELAWRQQCSSCHGPVGKGDGQMGPMLKAPDLTRDDWQAQVTDAQIATTIKNGKGKMPGFNVPDQVVQGLVARVRATRGR